MNEHEDGHDDRRRNVLKVIAGSATASAFGAPTASASEESASTDDDGHSPISYDLKVTNSGATGDSISVEVTPNNAKSAEYARDFSLPALKERPGDRPDLSVATDDVNLRGDDEYEVTVQTPDGEATETFDVPRGGIDAYNAILVTRKPTGSTDISWVVV